VLLNCGYLFAAFALIDTGSERRGESVHNGGAELHRFFVVWGTGAVLVGLGVGSQLKKAV